MLQEAKDGPVVQEAVMALARAVQQLESRSLSRLEELKAQLRPPRPMSQTNSPAASASGIGSPTVLPLGGWRTAGLGHLDLWPCMSLIVDDGGDVKHSPIQLCPCDKIRLL